MKTGESAWRIPDEGLFGFAHCGGHDTWYPWSAMTFDQRLEALVRDMVECGANSFRPQIHWHQVEQVLTCELSGPEDVDGGLVEAYSGGEMPVDWGIYDRLVDSLVESGIEPHIVIGAAYDFQVPLSGYAPGFARAIPDRIGRDRYLGHVYLHARAAVRRYRDRVHMWQLENELNGAAETLLMAHWRTGRAWFDTGFLTALIEVLSEAVREEDATALTSHNFHTDVRIIKGLYDWRNDVRRWDGFLDIIGVDTYPNYLFGRPSMGRAVGAKVRRAVEVAGGKPVMVLESGYPVRPRHRGMSESRQAEYARDSLTSAVQAGACGFYYYELCSPEGYPVEGPWSDRFFQSVEPWWGLVRRDGTRRPAFYEYGTAMTEARSALASRRVGTPDRPVG